MIDKTLRKATAERHGPVVVVRYTGGGDCLWLNMYLDCEQGQMVCDSDIGSYSYHWGRCWDGEDFISFCIRWFSCEEWLLRKCIDENHEELAFDLHETVLNLREAYDDIHNSGDEYDVDFEFDEVLDVANGYDNKEQFIAARSVLADERGVELPEKWWTCIVEHYTPWQKRFAEICREVIVPELKRMMDSKEKICRVNGAPCNECIDGASCAMIGGKCER